MKLKNLKFKIYNLQGQRGDTLIEVIFAFAILATIIGFAYSGVISARRSALASQERTQALQYAQYQTEALKAYRASLPWDSSTTTNFLGGGSGSSDIKFGTNDIYCMVNNRNDALGKEFWNLVVSNAGADCNSSTLQLQPQPGSQITTIKFQRIENLSTTTTTATSTDTLQANVSINWLDRNGQNQSVQNTVILTKQR